MTEYKPFQENMTSCLNQAIAEEEASAQDLVVDGRSESKHQVRTLNFRLVRSFEHNSEHEFELCHPDHKCKLNGFTLDKSLPYEATINDNNNNGNSHTSNENLSCDNICTSKPKYVN